MSGKSSFKQLSHVSVQVLILWRIIEGGVSCTWLVTIPEILSEEGDLIVVWLCSGKRSLAQAQLVRT